MSNDKNLQVADQCKAVAHMASAFVGVFSDYERIFRNNKVDSNAEDFLDSLTNRVGEHTAQLMELFGDIMNGMDICEDKDAWMEPVFKHAQELWPVRKQNNAHAAKPLAGSAIASQECKSVPEGWFSVDLQPVPENMRVLIQDSKEIAMGWKDRIDGRLYFAPQGGLVPFTPTHWMHIPAAPSDVPAPEPSCEGTNPAATKEVDWKEDAAHENGNYQNRCTYCNTIFIGHKRRVVCYSCSTTIADAVAQSSDVIAERKQ